MYVPGIYIAWTHSKQVCTRKCMEKQYVRVYTWYIPRTMTFVLYILVCTWSVHGINLSVYGSSLFMQFHTLKMQIHSLNLLNLSVASMYAIRTRMNWVHTMLVYRNQLFCTYLVHARVYTLRMALAGGQLSWGISAKTCLAASVSVCHCLNHAEWCPDTKRQKCHRKAAHLPEPFLGCIYVYEQGMYRKADSCTIALYIASWRRHMQVCSGKYLNTIHL